MHQLRSFRLSPWRPASSNEAVIPPMEASMRHDDTTRLGAAFDTLAAGSGRTRAPAWAAALRALLRSVDRRWPARLTPFLLALTLVIGLPELLARGFLAA
jgi:hypothetical protein